MSVRGAAGWSATYSKQYGKERWSALLNALAQVPEQLAFVSPSISHSALRYLLRRLRFMPCLVPNCLTRGSTSSKERLPTAALYVGNDFHDEGGARRSCGPDTVASTAGSSCSKEEGYDVADTGDLHRSALTIDDEHIIEEAKEKTYFLDGASALAAYALGACPGETVLDMCAAPGGKSLILSCMITSARVPSWLDSSQLVAPEASSVDDEQDEGGMLVCNDVSRDRLARLRSTLFKFLPDYATAGPRLQFSCADVCKGGTFGQSAKWEDTGTWCFGGWMSRVSPERFAPYDKILLDAPCSSDRHLLHQGGSAIVNWSSSRASLQKEDAHFSCGAPACGFSGTPKAHAERQLKMLIIASKLLKRNGILLYTTCSLSQTENDGVIEKFLKKSKFCVKILPLFEGQWPPEVKLVNGAACDVHVPRDLPLMQTSSAAAFSIEKLKFGYAMLPDVSKFGPMYFCKMQIMGQRA